MDFDARHRAFYAMLDAAFQDARLRQRFEPKGRVPMPDAPVEPIRGPVDPGDGPTPQRRAMAGDMLEDFLPKDGKLTVRLLDDSVIESLYTRGSLSGDQYVAGSTFYSDWYEAGLSGSGVIDPMREVVDGGTHKPVSDRQLDALFRFKRAILAIGSQHSKAAIAMVIIGEKPEQYGRREHHRKPLKDARTAGITSLQNALSELDVHYYGQRRNRTRTFHGPDSEAGIPPIDTRGPEF